MHRGAILLVLIAVAVGIWAVRLQRSPKQELAPRARDVAQVEPTPLCPWRNPGQDLASLFPPATNYVMEKRVLSGVMAPVQKELGRAMQPDENPLRIYRVEHEGQKIGSVLVSRAKAEHGGIELVLGLETNGIVRGLSIQSQREPPVVAAALTNRAWLDSFAGKSLASRLQPGADLADVPEPARVSAQAIASRVRDLLIVNSFAEKCPEASEWPPVDHH